MSGSLHPFVAGSILALLTGTSHAQTLLATLQPPPPRMLGGYGSAMCTLGDVDRDGVPDFAAGAPNDTWNGNSGRIYVYSGRTLTTLFEILGPGTSQVGGHVESAGDWNADGDPDLFASSEGWSDQAHVFSGNGGALLASFSYSPKFVGNSKWRVLGDVDGDGVSDLAVGESNHFVNPGNSCGRVTVISGATKAVLWSKIGNSQASEFLGIQLAGLGDVNGDRIPDLACATRAGFQGYAGSIVCLSGTDGTLLRTLPAWAFTYVSFGTALANVGDVNGDGVADIAVGDPGYDPGGRVQAGRAGVFSGSTGAPIPGLDWTGSSAYQRLGHRVAGAGDADNDGWRDIMVTSQPVPGAGNSAGAVEVFSGKTGATLFRFQGSQLDQLLGDGVASAGDLDRDGSADLLIGVLNGTIPSGYNRIRVYSGIRNSGIGNSLYLASAFWSLPGSAAGDQCGWSAHGGGDLDGDGYADFLVGANAVDVGNLVNAGEVQAISGRHGTVLYTFRGSQLWNYLGDAVRIVRDVNHDGRPDILLGGHGFVSGGLTDVGQAILYSGATGAKLKDFTGTVALQGLGLAVASAGDVDRDGDGDILLAAPTESRNGNRSGSAYLHGGSTKSFALLFRFDGDSAGDEFGTSLDGVGDVNGDGYDDVAIGSPFDDSATRFDCGSVKVHSGKDGALLRTIYGLNPGDHLGQSLAGMGDLDGDGAGDVLVGAPDADPKGASSGRAYVFSGRTGAILFMFDGQSVGEQLGKSVASAGDVDHDGKLDAILGCPGVAGTGGRALVHSGRTGRLLWWFDGGTNDDLGLVVAGAGDVTGDGYADLIVGAPQQSSQAGAGYVRILSGYDAVSLTFGSGCPGSGGRIPEIVGSGLPRLGNSTHRIDLQKARPSSAGVLGIGLAVQVVPLGGSCLLLPASPATLAFTTNGIGSASIALPVPNQPGLLGGNLFFQGVILDPAGAGLGTLALSQGLHLLVGRQ